MFIFRIVCEELIVMGKVVVRFRFGILGMYYREVGSFLKFFCLC